MKLPLANEDSAFPATSALGSEDPMLWRCAWWTELYTVPTDFSMSLQIGKYKIKRYKHVSAEHWIGRGLFNNFFYTAKENMPFIYLNKLSQICKCSTGFRGERRSKSIFEWYLITVVPTHSITYDLKERWKKWCIRKRKSWIFLRPHIYFFLRRNSNLYICI